MFRALTLVSAMVVLSGCVNTPNTKALITPVVALGVHSFEPERSPDRMPPPSTADGVARIAANAQACQADENCVANP